MPKLSLRLIEPTSIDSQVGQIFNVEAYVEANDVKEGYIEINLDERFLKLVDSKKKISLPAGNYRQTVSWNVFISKPIKETQVVIKAVAGLVQMAAFMVRAR